MALPRSIHIVRILIGIQVYRLYGLSLIPLWLNNTLPGAFVIPIVTGDVLTAIFAPVIAIGISFKTGARVWAAALIWNSLGLVDLFFALALSFYLPQYVVVPVLLCRDCNLATVASYLIANDVPVIIGALAGIILHTASIIILLRKNMMTFLTGMK